MFSQSRIGFAVVMIAFVSMLLCTVTPKMSGANAKRVKGAGVRCGADCGPGGIPCAASNPCNDTKPGQQCTHCFERTAKLCNISQPWYDLCYDDADKPCRGKTGPCKGALGIGYTCEGLEAATASCGKGADCAG